MELQNQIKSALKSSRHLLNDEIQCIIDKDVEEEYQMVIDEIEEALVSDSLPTQILTLENVYGFIESESQYVDIEELKSVFEEVLEEIDIVLKLIENGSK